MIDPPVLDRMLRNVLLVHGSPQKDKFWSSRPAPRLLPPEVESIPEKSALSSPLYWTLREIKGAALKLVRARVEG